MTVEQIASIIMMACMLIMVIGGVHLAFVLVFLAVVFGLIFQGPMIFYLSMFKIFGVMQSEILIAVPLFVFMGLLLDKSGVAEKIFQSLYEVFGPVRGGLAIATIVTCAVFASCTGVIAATVATMTLLAVPPMLKRRYDKGLSTGVVCAGGSLGILIPPSVMLIMYGPMANLSVAKLFAAALFPGLLLSVLYIGYIVVLCVFSKKAAPAISAEEMAAIGPGRFRRAAWNMLPAAFLVASVLGLIIGGVTTPTEGAGIGALAAMILTAINKELNMKNLTAAAEGTLIVTSMVMFIIIFSGIYNSVFLFLGGGTLIKGALMALPFGKWFVLSLMMFILFIGGFFISWQGLLYIVIPIFLPVVKELGFDPLWFAILVCLNLQMSLLTPPFAYSIFFVKGVAPPEVSTMDIYRGVMPFVGMQALAVGLCIIFPDIILWLPRVTMGGG
ncbi:MAG: TRAP transporter large permease subunit [Desulfuromusa sp.]|nr:TRAP transporter large permease subunit [Desulfuromusa sp.]